MQISVSCFNCGWAIFGRAVTKIDNASCDLQCTRCGAILRLTAVLIHEGKPFDDASYWYTYDAENNKIPLRKAQDEQRS